jgi:5-methylcytosine-specific restriction endonuclease McrA
MTVVVTSPPYVSGDDLKVAHRTVSSETRRRILERDGEVCGICASIFGPFVVDHRTPVARGGTHDDSNLWVLCEPCNGDKGSMTIAEFADLLARYGVSFYR